MTSSKFLHHGPCNTCGSSDGNAVFDDGHSYCFVCEQHSGTAPSTAAEKTISSSPDVTPLASVFRAIPRRGLTEEAIKKYNIDVCLDKTQDVAHRYPYFRNGQHVANKVRKRTEKKFYWEGDPDGAELFGQHLFPPGSAKSVTVVEGELDAPSGWLLLGSRYPAVSVPSVGHAVKACQTNYEYLDSFDEIVFCFDKDDEKERPDGSKFFPGQEAARKCAELFPGKCRILTLQEGKDPNEYRQHGIDPKVFVSEWWKAPKYTPDGLIQGTDMWDKIINRPTHFQTPYPFEGLNKLTYGVRLSEFVVVNAPTGVGKTSILKEIEYAILCNPEVKEKGYGIGFLHLEELDSDLALGLMSIHRNKRYNLPDTEKTVDELRSAYDEIINTNRVVIYDHFGSNEIDSIISKVKHMAALGCKYIVLDHLSIVVSDQSGDERKQLDEISTKLKTFCMEANVALIAVIHQNRNGQIRGTAGVEQLANIILRLERDLTSNDAWRRNVTKVSVDKNRFCGRTGPGCYLFFDDITGRMVELSDEEVIKYEEGGTLTDADFPF